MNKAQQIADEIRSKRPNLRTRDDVSFVLKSIAPPGEKRDLKKEVVDLLFPGLSPQRYKTSTDLESYGEF